MSRPHRFLLLIGAFVLVAALAVWPGRWSWSAYANVTLVSFTASTLPGKPEIYIEWETATEFDTVGFFILRSDSAAGTYARVSDFIPHEGDTVVGAQYGWIDTNTVLSRTYWYKLEEITQSQGSNFYGPISATAGVSATNTPTATATPTPTATSTVTRTPTTTPTIRSDTTSTDSTTPSDSGSVATPVLATGATITPRPTAAGNSAGPAASAATPTLSSGAKNSPTPTAIAASLPTASNVLDLATAVLPPVVADVTQAQAPALTPTDVAPARDAPAVIVTEVSPLSPGDSSGSSPGLILIAAAFLFMGVAFIILRQARQ